MLRVKGSVVQRFRERGLKAGFICSIGLIGSIGSEKIDLFN